MSKKVQIGIDIGGTFTDVVALDSEGHFYYLKTPSTPENQSIGVLNGLAEMLKKIQLWPRSVQRLAHGTTIATNAFLERKGAQTALLVTKGFRDILHIGRQTRPNLYDLKATRPPPLISRRFRCEVDERVRHTGMVEQAVNTQQIRSIIADLQEAGIESIAICFLHAYINPENERLAAQIVREMAPGLPVTVSSDILPEFREFERMSTTVLNAYVQPVVARYIDRLVKQVAAKGITPPVLVMQSNGGMMQAKAVAERSVHTLLSGPAGGVLAAAYLAELTGYANCITADVGGTSFDVATIVEGQPTLRTEGMIEGYVVKFPHFDIHTIGAGGGSIAWIDSGGAVRVGPESAGVVPGPVCYGWGGSQPTVTDAHAALGNFGGGTLQGGALSLDIAGARQAIHDNIAQPLNISLEVAAEGILRIVNASMARAIRVMTVERGLDPHHFTLIPYGGAGPLHAVALARQLGIGQILIPVAPGNFSAFGLLIAPARYDGVRIYRAHGEQVDLAVVNAYYDQLQREIAAQLQKENFTSEDCSFDRQADLRYLGQSYELTVAVPNQPLEAQVWQQIEQRFHQYHERYYGFAKTSDPVEVVNLRLSGFGPQSSIQLPQLPLVTDPAQPIASHAVYTRGHWLQTAIYDRTQLGRGQEIAGPAIIQEPGATIVLEAGDKATADTYGNLLITIEA